MVRHNTHNRQNASSANYLKILHRAVQTPQDLILVVICVSWSTRILMTHNTLAGENCLPNTRRDESVLRPKILRLATSLIYLVPVICISYDGAGLWSSQGLMNLVLLLAVQHAGSRSVFLRKSGNHQNANLTAAIMVTLEGQIAPSAGSALLDW